MHAIEPSGVILLRSWEERGREDVVAIYILQAARLEAVLRDQEQAVRA
jgi:hypothetical protein